MGPEYLQPHSLKCGHGPAAPASLGSLLQVWGLRPQPRPSGSESAFNKVLGGQ